jgi:hypothetical protein
MIFLFSQPNLLLTKLGQVVETCYHTMAVLHGRLLPMASTRATELGLLYGLL